MLWSSVYQTSAKAARLKLSSGWRRQSRLSPTACVLDTHIDPDHNRSVITFVAAPEMMVEAALRAVGLAAELIDMRRHSGVHPRLGATDVLPFVPISGVTMEDCVALAHQAGERIARELSIPVFFYERAALKPERVNLEDVRRGALELLREQIAVESRSRSGCWPAAGSRNRRRDRGRRAAFSDRLQRQSARLLMSRSREALRARYGRAWWLAVSEGARV